MNPDTPNPAESTPEAKENALSSPAELGAVSCKLGASERLSFEKFGVHYSFLGGKTEYELPDGSTIEGLRSFTVRIGGEKESGFFDIVDLSHNGQLENGRQAGHEANPLIPIESESNFGLVTRDNEGRSRDFRPLMPGESVEVGRGEGKLGSEYWPDTVSRDHLKIGIEARDELDRGKLVIENHNPLNETAVNLPYASPDYDRSFEVGTEELILNLETPLEELPSRDEMKLETYARLRLDSEKEAQIIKATPADKKSEADYALVLVDTESKTASHPMVLTRSAEYELDTPGRGTVALSVDQDDRLHMKQIGEAGLGLSLEVKASLIDQYYVREDVRAPKWHRRRPLNHMEAGVALDPRTGQPATTYQRYGGY